MLRLKIFKGKGPGVIDLLNWAALIDEGIVQNKDGSLLAGWFYRGPDVACSTADERNALCVRVNAALNRLAGGWAAWIDAARTDAAGYPDPELSYFPDPVSQLLDDERRAMFEAEGAHFESDYTIILQYTPPLRRNSRLLDYIYDVDPAERQTPASRILDQFSKDLASFEDTIGNAVVLRRMRGFSITDAIGTEFLSEELVNYLHYCLNDEIQALKIPRAGGYLDTIIGVKDLWVSDTPLYGEEFIAVVRISGFPEESFPQILAALDHLQICYRWNTRFIFMEQHEAVTKLHQYHRKWKQRIRGFLAQLFKTQGGVINEDALLMVQQAQSAISVAESGQAAYGYHTAVVTLRHADRIVLLERARLIRKTIRNCQFASEIEDFNAVEAWLGSLPGHSVPNVRRPPEHTDNLSNLLPLSSKWTGSPVHPNPLYPPNSPPLFVATSDGATPFRTSLHYGDSGHVLWFGPKGSGKSTDLCTIAWSFLRYPGATVWALDKGRSMKTLCQALKGIHYEVAGDGSPSFCPLADLDTPTDRAMAGDWIATCFELALQRPPLPEHTDAIHRALQLLAADNNRSITHFCATVQDHEVRDVMTYYSLAGPMGHLYDAEQDGLADHHFVVLEISDLLALRPQAAIPAFLHIFRKFKRLLKGQPAALLIDEAHMVFDRELLSEKLREALKEFRKAVCAVHMATQSLSDAMLTSLFSVLVESCDYKICLANPDAAVEGTERNPGPKDLYLAMGYNEVEIDIIRFMTPKLEMYIKCPEGRRKVRLDLGPAQLAFCGVSDPKDLARVARCQQQYGDEWPYRWIEEQQQPHHLELVEAAE